MAPRRWVSFLFILGLALGLISTTLAMSTSADQSGLSYARIVRLSVVRGDVQIARGGSNNWEPAALNMPLQQGFAVGTNQGLAEIELEHGSVVWVAPNSVLQFTELALSGGGQITKIALTEGTATFDASVRSQDVFSVSNQNFQVAPDGKSEFRVDLTRDGASVTVLKGKITVQSPQGSQTLNKGEMYFLGVRKPQQTGVSAAPKDDEWDTFVKQRETYLETSAERTGQYTTAPFSYGMADLSSYGGWTFVPGVGYAWQPAGVSSDWMPFSNGSMMFYNGFGWTWVSTEPWGWVPYHFGQWTYASSNGWMWVPGNYTQWSPATVHWVQAGNKVGWTPLAEVKNSSESKTPTVVLANKGLNNFDSYKVLKLLKEGQTIQMLASSPGAQGKLGTTSDMRLMVPTAKALSNLSQGFSQEDAEAVAGAPAISRLPAQSMATQPSMNAINNGIAGARLVNSRPPARLMGNGLGGAQNAGGIFRNNSAANSSMAAGSATNAPSAAHASSGGGKPH
jgi:hypothetical protein